MKKVLVLLIAIVGLTGQSMAQMTLKVPKWNKFVKINAEGVNLRKSPNRNSPKLLSRGWDWSTEFSWTAKEDFATFHLEPGIILPVLKETDEWYCLYFAYPAYSTLLWSSEIYIMKQYCTEVSPIGISRSDYMYGELEEVPGTKGYLVGVYYLGSATREPWCRIGHRVGRYVVMANYGGDGMDFANQFISDEEFIIDEVTDADVEKYIRSQKQPSIFDIWIVFPGVHNVQMFVVDMTKYKYPVTTSTLSK